MCRRHATGLAPFIAEAPLPALAGAASCQANSVHFRSNFYQVTGKRPILKRLTGVGWSAGGRAPSLQAITQPSIAATSSGMTCRTLGSTAATSSRVKQPAAAADRPRRAPPKVLTTCTRERHPVCLLLADDEQSAHRDDKHSVLSSIHARQEKRVTGIEPGGTWLITGHTWRIARGVKPSDTLHSSVRGNAAGSWMPASARNLRHSTYIVQNVQVRPYCLWTYESRQYLRSCLRTAHGHMSAAGDTCRSL